MTITRLFDNTDRKTLQSSSIVKMVDRRRVGICVYLQDNQAGEPELHRTLKIPDGEGAFRIVDGPAEPGSACSEGSELYYDLAKAHRGEPRGTVIFDGTQYDWEEGIINRALASRGQRIDFDRQ